MTLKTILTALTLTLAPGLALAMGCSSSASEQVMSCAEGSQMDTETGTCIPVVSS